jgi:rSAM/selenodomain-associated transferase 1
MNNAALIVFAKAPIAGSTKTRLIPAIGKENAARVQEALIEYVHETVIKPIARDRNVFVFGTPYLDFPIFERLHESRNVFLNRQIGNNLGERMVNAFEFILRRYEGAVIIGTDCPAMQAQHVESAFAQLEKNDAVIAPATDGGYVLLGLRENDSALFNGVNWGSNQVFTQTKQRLVDAQLKTVVMEALPDIDRPEDLDELLRYLPELEALVGPATVVD